MELIKQYHVLTWLNIGLIPLLVIAVYYKAHSISLLHKKFVNFLSRYISTRQAVNDLMEVIIFNINDASSKLVQARDVIKSINQNKDSKLTDLSQAVSQFSEYNRKLTIDNQQSIDRSYSNEIFKRVTVENPFKSIWFWFPTFFSLSLLAIQESLNYPMALNNVLILVIINLEFFVLYLSIKRINRIRLLKNNTEHQLLTIMSLLDIRRTFLMDSAEQLSYQYNQLEAYKEYYQSVPQARGYSRALANISSAIDMLKQGYEFSRVNVNPALISLSTYLNKKINEQYKLKAEAQKVNLVNKIKTGLSVRISPENISKLLDPLIEDALNSTAVDKSVLISGQHRSNKVELEIIDQRDGIEETDLKTVFKFDPNKKTDITKYPILTNNLRMARLFVSTIGGEIKLSDVKQGGLKIKLILPKIQSQNIIKVHPVISRSSSPLN